MYTTTRVKPIVNASLRLRTRFRHDRVDCYRRMMTMLADYFNCMHRI